MTAKKESGNGISTNREGPLMASFLFWGIFNESTKHKREQNSKTVYGI